MSAKDFIALADCFRDLRTFDSETVIAVLCRFCRSRNPRFSESKFRGYLAGQCGPRGGKLRNTPPEEDDD